MKKKVAKAPPPALTRGKPKGPVARSASARKSSAPALEPLDARKSRGVKVLDRLAEAYPGAGIELAFTNPLELLVATILSAQCTDERVNVVTAELFKRYKTARDYAEADPEQLERDIHSTGFFKAKTRSLMGMGRALLERHGGEVPSDPEALVELPGVGRKTASVVLGNAFGIPAVAVDTHVFRVSQRLGLARADEADDIQDQLMDVLPQPRWTQATHLVIIHGRRTCLARAPECPRCAVVALCPWPEKTASAAAPGGRVTAKSRK